MNSKEVENPEELEHSLSKKSNKNDKDMRGCANTLEKTSSQKDCRCGISARKKQKQE